MTARNVPVDDVLDRLRERGGRVTSGRRAILEVLLAGPRRHLSAEQIVEGVRSRMPDIAESTIYRTLATLEEMGVIDHVHLGHGPATYHLSGAPHRHLVCTGCNEVVEVPAEAFEELTRQIHQRYGFTLHDEHFALSGRCRACPEGENA